MKPSIAAFLAFAIQSSNAQACYDDLLLPENSFSLCLVQNAGECAQACSNSPALDFQPGVKFSCAEVEEQMCPAIRCCEECWEKSQLTYQCSFVDSSILAGLIEEGCVLDCSSFPIGGTNDSPTPAPVNTGTPPNPTVAPVPNPTMAPVPPTMDAPTDMPAEKTCDEDAEDKKFEDCIEANGCTKDVTCAQRFSQIQLDSSNFNDICSYFEPALCVVDACCPQCSDEYRNSLACASEGSVLGCTNLSCDNNVLGGSGGDANNDSGASSKAATLMIVLGLFVANAVNQA